LDFTRSHHSDENKEIPLKESILPISKLSHLQSYRLTKEILNLRDPILYKVYTIAKRELRRLRKDWKEACGNEEFSFNLGEFSNETLLEVLKIVNGSY
jgi:hypothetical protein